MSNPSDPPSEERVELEQKVLELRRAGVPFSEIATRLGYYDKGGAYKVYKAAMNRAYKEPVGELRALESDRLDRLQVARWGRALRGDAKAVDQVLKIMERRARLLGLDHADGIAERIVQLEADKVRLIALSFGKVLDALGLTDEQRTLASRLLISELRKHTAGDDDGDDGPAGVLVPAS